VNEGQHHLRAIWFTELQNCNFQGPVPGPPFLCGALLVFVAILLNWTLPSGRKKHIRRQNSRIPDAAPLIDRHDLLLPTSKEAEEWMQGQLNQTSFTQFKL
jgi:hypothetical protein